MRLIPRVVSKWYAAFFGYFWVPCPSCGVEFGGHEWSGLRDPAGHFSSIPDGDKASTSWGICSACTAAGVGCRAQSVVRRYHLGCSFVAVPEVGSG